MWTKTQAERKHEIITQTTGDLVKQMILTGTTSGQFHEYFIWAHEELNERFKHIDSIRIDQLKLDWEEKEKQEKT